MENDPTEFEPVQLSDQTEVKIPVASRSFDPDHPTKDSQLTPMLNDNPVVTPLDDSFTLDPEVVSDLVEIQRLRNLVGDVPGDMFVNQILLDYHHSETNLEQCRDMLFSILRESEVYPFDVECELKKRINTRGVSLPSKLAYDIHSLVAIMEGEDISMLKDMLSTSKKPSRKPSVRATQSAKGSDPQTHSQCKAELSQLKSVVTSLQSDILLIKQRQSAAETRHESDIKSFKKEFCEKFVKIQILVKIHFNLTYCLLSKSKVSRKIVMIVTLNPFRKNSLKLKTLVKLTTMQ